jgi:NhaP-type Na+/H+ or K+/H+ antiporter
VLGFSLFDLFLSLHTAQAAPPRKLLDTLLSLALSTVLGYLTGLLVALLVKPPYLPALLQAQRLQRHQANSRSHIGYFLLLPWTAYLIAESLNLSGIVAIFCCGMSLSQFAVHNITGDTQRVSHF